MAAGAVGSQVLLVWNGVGDCLPMMIWHWGGAAGWVCLHELTQELPRALPFGQPENSLIARSSKFHFPESQTQL